MIGPKNRFSSPLKDDSPIIYWATKKIMTFIDWITKEAIFESTIALDAMALIAPDVPTFRAKYFLSKTPTPIVDKYPSLAPKIIFVSGFKPNFVHILLLLFQPHILV